MTKVKPGINQSNVSRLTSQSIWSNIVKYTKKQIEQTVLSVKIFADNKL